jgi:anti-anti-sigma factor
MRYCKEFNGSDIAILIEGSLNFEDNASWRDMCKRTLEANPKTIKLDMQNVTACDSSGLSMILVFDKFAKARNIDFQVVAPRNKLLENALHQTSLSCFREGTERPNPSVTGTDSSFLHHLGN